MLARRLFAPAVKTASRMAPKVSRPMSTILEGKERAEEARYIKQIEAAREAEIRKNLERILALEAGHEEKQELVELLCTCFIIFDRNVHQLMVLSSFIL